MSPGFTCDTNPPGVGYKSCQNQMYTIGFLSRFLLKFCKLLNYIFHWFQILAIEGLSVYWNPKTHLSFLLLPQTDIVSAFQEGIATKDDLAKSYQYSQYPSLTFANSRCRKFLKKCFKRMFF